MGDGMAWAGVRRVVLLLGFSVVVVAATSGCSAQKPSSKVEGAHAENKMELDKRLTLSSPPSRSPVRIDYLRHVSDIQHPEVFVYKERRRLYLVDSNVVVRDYPVGLGRQAWGDKEREGDGRTPEGFFMVFSKNSPMDRGSALKLKKTVPVSGKVGAGVSRLASARFGHVAGVSDLQRLMVEQSAWVGQFSIHGGGAQADWTDGSVALYASDMEELAKIVGIGTSVTVRP